MAKQSMNEYELGTVTASWQELVPEAAEELGNKMILRNNTGQELEFRINENDKDRFTAGIDEKFTIGGFTSIKRKKIEVRINQTPVANSIKLNLFS